MQAGAAYMQGADQVPAAVQDRISQQQCTSLPHAATGVAEGEQGKTRRRQGKLIVRTRTVPFDKQGPRFHHQRWRRGSMHCYSVFFQQNQNNLQTFWTACFVRKSLAGVRRVSLRTQDTVPA
jgi:hypothetical protein